MFLTSIGHRVFAKCSGQVAAAATGPATEPAVKFAPIVLHTIEF